MPYVYVGTYSDALYVYQVDESGGLRLIQRLTGVQDTSYLVLSADRRCLYAVNELDPVGTVTALAVDASSGHVQPINSVGSGGAVPAHLSLDPSGRWLLVANYGSGTIASLRVQDDGSLGDVVDVVAHTGSGPNLNRQQTPHPHMIVTDPSGAFVLVPDLGIDRVVVYRLEPRSGRLLVQADAGGRLQPGAGPRHIAFDSSVKHAYVLNELDSTIVAFDFDAKTGAMTAAQTLSTLPDGFEGENWPAAVVVHPSGRFLYCSNRGHDSIAGFGIDQTTGQLQAAGHSPTGGRNPRDFNVEEAGAVLIAGNKDSNTLVTFRVETGDGSLQPTRFVTEVPAPARVLFSPEG